MIKHKHLSTWHNLRIGVFCAFSVILILSAISLNFLGNTEFVNNPNNIAKAANVNFGDTQIGGANMVSLEKVFLINGKEEDKINITHNVPVTVRLKYNNLDSYAITSAQIKDSLPTGFIYVQDSFRNCLTPSVKEVFCDKADTAQRNLNFLALTDGSNPGTSPTAGLYDGPIDLYAKNGTAIGAKSGYLEIGKKRYIHQYRCFEEDPTDGILSRFLLGLEAVKTLKRKYLVNDWYIVKPEAEGIDNKNGLNDITKNILDNLLFDFDNEVSCKTIGPMIRYSQISTLDMRVRNTNNRYLHGYKCTDTNLTGKGSEVNDSFIPTNEFGGINNKVEYSENEMKALDSWSNCKGEGSRKSEQTVFDTLGKRFVHHYTCKDNNFTLQADEVNDWHIPGKNEQGVNNKPELSIEDKNTLDIINKCSGKGSRKNDTRVYDMLDNTRGSGYLEYTMKSPFMSTLYTGEASIMSTNTAVSIENFNPITKPIIIKTPDTINVVAPGTTIPNQVVYEGNPLDQKKSDLDTSSFELSIPTNNEPNGNVSNNVIDPKTGTTTINKTITKPLIIDPITGKVTNPANSTSATTTGATNNPATATNTSSNITSVPKNGELPVASSSAAVLTPPKITISALTSSKSSVCQLGQIEQKDSLGVISCKSCTKGNFCDGLVEATAKFASEDPYICGSSITGAALGYDPKTDRIKVNVTRNTNNTTANAEPTPTSNGFFEVTTSNLDPDTYYIEFELFRNGSLVANTSKFTAYINKLEQCNSTPTVRTGGFGSIVAIMVLLGTVSMWGALYYHDKHKTHMQEQYIEIKK